jgi:hypothetical protein
MNDERGTMNQRHFSQFIVPRSSFIVSISLSFGVQCPCRLEDETLNFKFESGEEIYANQNRQ